ncbi:MAG: hypothetical protein JRH07_13405, partial [Deltaproteobacteria bacterium]|nr:hypothetical protein [Deltaproteobacteria bacterium]
MKFALRLLLWSTIFLPFVLEGEALAQWRGYGGWGMGPGMMGWGYGMGWFGMILMAAFWIAVIVGIVFLIRWLVLSARGTSHTGSSGESPLEILKKR